MAPIFLSTARARSPTCSWFNTSLQLLVLEDTNVGTDGARVIARRARGQFVADIAHLYSNELGDAGARVLAKALKRMNDATGNYQMGDGGTRTLADALKTNTSLAVLNLDSAATSTARTYAPQAATWVTTVHARSPMRSKVSFH